MRNILITGGTGLVGTKLTELLLLKGYSVTVITRNINPINRNPAVKYALWDIKKDFIDIAAIQEADFIIHLAGSGVVEKKWTKSYKNEIVNSRIKSSDLIVNTLKKSTHKVKAIISSSAIGWYGTDSKSSFAFKETDLNENSFLGNTCKDWEESITEASQLGIRVCKLRTGIVLSNKGGALAEFIKPINYGIAAILGNGSQIVSWIHIEDLCRLFIYAIENDQLEGSFNAVAPRPVSNKTLTLSLASLLKRNFFIPIHVPVFLLKIIMGERSIEVLKSTTVSCEKIKEMGFTFYHPSVEPALKDLFPAKL
jgi:uncharacterized protein (TIGR01777 family)